MSDNVSHFPKHRSTQAGKHREETAAVHYLVHNCQELKEAIAATNNPNERTRDYFVKKAREFGCLENIPHTWHFQPRSDDWTN
jgi:hypothetical protein